MDDGSSDLVLRSSALPEKEWSVGSFSTPTLQDLRTRGLAVLASAAADTGGAPQPGGVTLHHIAVSDALELHAQNPDSVIMAASQFNYLEFPHALASPEQGIACYAYDMTQGPACALACAAGTVYRNYFAPVRRDGSSSSGSSDNTCSSSSSSSSGRSGGGGGDDAAAAIIQQGQTSAVQLNALGHLEDMLDNATHKYWRVQNGYNTPGKDDMERLGRRLAEFSAEEIEGPVMGAVSVGLHERVGVTFCDRQYQPLLGGLRAPRVTQLYASALALGEVSSDVRQAAAPLARLVLQAAYEATLWAAVLAASDRDKERREGGGQRERTLEKEKNEPAASAAAATAAAVAEGAETGEAPIKVFLTFIGGGVFRNDDAWIADAIGRAVVRLGQSGARLRVYLCYHKKVNEATKKAVNAAMRTYF
jgi:hypothetical protein